jgi:SH3-like domain-containing protein
MVPAIAQTADPAPYLHTAPHHQVRHKSRKATVPVVTPRHAGAPRRAPRPSAKPASPKPVMQAAKPAPKKPAPPPLPANIGPNTGLPLPRYAALKSDDVNMRAGPGERYPVLWTYQRRDLPVKIEHEFDVWRQVEDMDGIKGWMQQGFLVGHRSFVITGTQDRTLRSDASDTADPVAVLKPGVVGRIRACDAAKEWCQVQVQDYRGWLKRADFWGADPGEAITP